MRLYFWRNHQSNKSSRQGNVVPNVHWAATFASLPKFLADHRRELTTNRRRESSKGKETRKREAGQIETAHPTWQITAKLDWRKINQPN